MPRSIGCGPVLGVLSDHLLSRRFSNAEEVWGIRKGRARDVWRNWDRVDGLGGWLMLYAVALWHMIKCMMMLNTDIDFILKG